jgi:hypothetical protein
MTWRSYNGTAGQYNSAVIYRTQPRTDYRIARSSRARRLEPPGRSVRPNGCGFISGAFSVPITFQSTVGGFSSDFMSELPKLEQAMLAHGLEPSEFVISKDWATPATYPFIGPFFYDYTVFVGDESFTVTEPNDMRFLEYFYDRCISQDAVEPEPVPRASRPGLINRVFRWMSQPI